MIHYLAHSKIRLALHEIRAGHGRSLLLLHGLAERSPEHLPEEYEDWPGPVHALDFTGHGQSTIPVGGGYTCELLMGDVDIALAHLETATIAGRGLGGYVALLTLGARPKLVKGIILGDGPGLAGGSARPGTPLVPVADPHAVSPPDPYAIVELAGDIRPPDYASSFVRQATSLSDLDRPISVCARERPEWLEAVAKEPGVQEVPLAEALAEYASVQ
ncbi:MAG: alpha/beta hydrolase [bacterium]|nr:alpha/beta hydrolase [bacterium]